MMTTKHCGLLLLMWLTLGTLVCQVSGQCDGSTLVLTATGLPQYLTTPDYPASYPLVLSATGDPNGCSWLVRNDNSRSIVLNVEEIITDNCTLDSLDVYDGDSNNSTYLGSYCTNDPVMIVSSGTSLYIEFPPDGFSKYRISAVYFITDDAFQPPCNVTLTNATSDPTYVMSRNLPDAYPVNLNCWYKIYASTLYAGIAFTVIFMDIEDPGGCAAGLLTFYSGTQESETRFEWFCEESHQYKGFFTAPIIVGGDYVLVTLTTGPSNDGGHRGFYISYTEESILMDLLYPELNGTLYLTANESHIGTINETVGYIFVNHTGSLLYDFTRVDGVQYFTLTENRSDAGHYTVDLRTTVDYETIQQLTSVLSFQCNYIPQLTMYVTINLTITDVDDNPPTFLNLPGNVTLGRQAKSGFFVYQVETNDSDPTEEFQSVSFSISSSDDQYGLLSVNSLTGAVTLETDAAIVPSTVTEYIVGITATSTFGNVSSLGNLTLTFAPDQPPACSHAAIYADSLNNNRHEAFMDIEYDEPWSCVDEFEITYTIGSVSPLLSSPLFDIDENYGDLWLVRRYTEDELDVTQRFEVEVIATDTELQSASFLVIINTTTFGCFPNPQILTARMGDPPGTVLKNDFNCTDTTGLTFSIKKQYPSNVFQMATYPDGTYALILRSEVYKIQFYSLVLRIFSGTARITLKFQIIVQTNVCTVEEVNTNG